MKEETFCLNCISKGTKTKKEDVLKKYLITMSVRDCVTDNIVRKNEVVVDLCEECAEESLEAYDAMITQAAKEIEKILKANDK